MTFVCLGIAGWAAMRNPNKKPMAKRQSKARARVFDSDDAVFEQEDSPLESLTGYPARWKPAPATPAAPSESPTCRFWEEYADSPITNAGTRESRFDERRAGGRSHVSWAWLAACLLFAGWFGSRLAPTHPAGPNPVALAASPRVQAIDTLRVGQRVVANDATGKTPGPTRVVPELYRAVSIESEMTWTDGTRDDIHIETLLPATSLAENEIVVGSYIPLPGDLVEMGMPEDLRGHVTAISPCPPIAEGPGNVVLTTVNHLNPYLFDLTFRDNAGARATVTVTGYHKIWSVDRQEWVSACELQRLERLRGVHGDLHVTQLERRIGAHRVYNLTVESEHVYRVSSFGALVHNDGCDELVDLTDAKARTHILDGDATGGGHRAGTGTSGKSEFPPEWDDKTILDHISDVATDPKSTHKPGHGGRVISEGTRDGVDIRVVVEPPSKGNRIVTGFPTNRPKNP